MSIELSKEEMALAIAFIERYFKENMEHTVGAIGAGAKATSVFGDAWFGVFSAVMILLILFLSA